MYLKNIIIILKGLFHQSVNKSFKDTCNHIVYNQILYKHEGKEIMAYSDKAINLVLLCLENIARG